MTNSKIAPHDGKIFIHSCGFFPERNRFHVSAAVVKQITEIVSCLGIARIDTHGGFENGDFLQSRRETIIRRQRGGSLETGESGCCVAEFLMQPTEGIMP